MATTNQSSLLSRNIRYLRKKRKLSQLALANALQVKRSNIAAYETKNVEPRLNLIYEISRYLDVSLTDLIATDLEEIDSDDSAERAESKLNYQIDQDKLQLLHSRSLEIKKLLEGFRVFYRYKHTSLQEEDLSGEKRHLQNDLENFLTFISHMIDFNEEVTDSLSRLPYKKRA
ncbi:MAG: helix-turn-helix transcriptional regulator [Saprospiraceae bacterium]